METQLTQDQINNINIAIKNFEFEKQIKIMEFLNWEWAFYNAGSGCREYMIPSKEQMIKLIKELATDAYKTMKETKSHHSCYQSGGFSITVYDDNSCNIDFIVNESTSKEY